MEHISSSSPTRQFMTVKQRKARKKRNKRPLFWSTWVHHKPQPQSYLLQDLLMPAKIKQVKKSSIRHKGKREGGKGNWPWGTNGGLGEAYQMCLQSQQTCKNWEDMRRDSGHLTTFITPYPSERLAAVRATRQRSVAARRRPLFGQVSSKLLYISIWEEWRWSAGQWSLAVANKIARPPAAWNREGIASREGEEEDD